MTNLTNRTRGRQPLWCYSAWACAALWSITIAALPVCGAIVDDPFAWPAITADAKPWTYWYWMGGAVKDADITRHLEQFQLAGFGGVHIIPVYGARGAEGDYVPFLSPRWMAHLDHTLLEADRLGLGVDMTTGTGWPFGGPWVEPRYAASRFEIRELAAENKSAVRELATAPKRDGAPAQLVVLMAYGPGGEAVEITDRLGTDGELNWQPPDDGWKLAALLQSPTNLPVERAAPGGEGPTVDHFSRAALTRYLRKFDEAFGDYSRRRVRSMYNDSYENWGENWTLNLFAEFERRRGYDLRAHLLDLRLHNANTSEQAQRVRADYRETVADLMRDEFVSVWVDWAHDHKMQIRNEGHGTPANLLDLYALADMPETEVFGTSWLEASGLEPLPGVPVRHGGPLEVQVCKLASSAAHVAGRPRCSSETFTWLGDHFKIPLEHMKAQADLMFAMGINHIFFHGSAYSPSDAAWPGWLWYASTNVAPYMPAWRQMPALCGYIARCQAWLQAGQPDQDVLVYFPIYDLWAEDEGARDGLQHTIVNNTDVWLEKHMSGFAETCRALWKRGYCYDCLSDRQLAELRVVDGKLVSSGGNEYRVLVLPRCRLMPVETLAQVSRLVANGATVVVVGQLPPDVPGWGKLDERRASSKMIRDQLGALARRSDDRRDRAAATGRLIIGDDVEPLLQRAGVAREALVDTGLLFVRRRDATGWNYFVVNFSGQPLEQWLPLAVPARDVVIFDAATRACGQAATKLQGDALSVFVQLKPRQSILIRATRNKVDGQAWRYLREEQSVALAEPWRVQFIEGGPSPPTELSVHELSDWTRWPDDTGVLKSFSGIARYVTEFELPITAADAWLLDLGEVCHSCTVRLNGVEVGQLITSPYQVDVSSAIRSGTNLLEVEVANLPANRIADLDRRGVDWKKFFFVNIRYHPFDASDWPPVVSGLLGPVRIVAQRNVTRAEMELIELVK